MQGQAAPATVEEAKQRLVAVLADPHMRLPDLSSEAARLAGQGGNGQADAAMQAGLSRMLTRSGGAFKALAAGVACTLQLHLLSGPWNVASDSTLQVDLPTVWRFMGTPLLLLHALSSHFLVPMRHQQWCCFQLHPSR